MRVLKAVYKWCTKTRLRKILSSTLALLILLTSVRFLFLKPKEAQAADSYLGLNEGYGSTTKDYSSNVTGTITNAVWKQEEFCKTGKCLYFDGSGDFVNFGNDSDLDFTTGSFTIEGWFRTPDITSGTRVLVAKYNSATGTDGGYKVYMDSSGYLIFGIDNDQTGFPSDSASTSTTAFDDNKWHYFSAVKNGTTSISLYVDGKLYQTDSSITTGSLTNSDSFYIGIDGNGSSNSYSGFLDEIKVYSSTARTQAEINADKLGETSNRGTSASFGPDQSYLSDGLVGYWKMDESNWTNDCSTDTVLDSSGNSAHGDSCPLTNGPDPSTGKFGNGALIDNTDDYISVANQNALIPNNGSWTVSAWAKPANASQTTIILIKPDFVGGKAEQYGMFICGDVNCSTGGQNFTAGLVENDGVTQRLALSTSDDADGNWHLYTMVADKSSDAIHLYKDGQKLTVTNSNLGSWPTVNNIDDLTIGGHPDAGGQFNGSIDELRIYNRALSPTEVSKLYNWAPGPVGHWKLDENTGTTANDSSGNANTGSITAGTGGFVSGKFGSAYNFDGADTVINAGSASMLDNLHDKNVTIEAWVYPRSSGELGEGIIISKEGGGDSGGWILTMASNNRVRFLVGRATTDMIARSTTALTLNKWTHVGVVYDGSLTATNVKLYINGVLDTHSFDQDGSGTRDSDAANSLVIGNVSNASQAFDGFIDDAKIYNYARTPGQIIEDMNAGHPAPGSPVGSATAFWKMDEGYGTIANDSSPNALNLTLNSASWTNSGKFGKAWNGTGANWLSISDASTSDKLDFAEDEDFTISFWMKSDSSTNPASTEYLVSKAEASPGYRIFANNDSSGTLAFGIDDDTSWTPGDKADTTTDVYDANWHHIVATKQGVSNIKIYVDSKLEGQDVAIAESGTLANSVSFVLGDRSGADGGDEFNGDLDDVRVFRSLLSQEQINLLYNQGSMAVMGALSTDSSGNASWSANDEYCPPGQGSACTPPIAHWKLDENTGTGSNAVKDTSGNNLHGTMQASMTGSDWVPGKKGAGLNFDGTDDLITVSDSTTLDISGSFTLSSWLKADTIPGTDEWMFIMSRDIGSNANYYFDVFENNLDCGFYAASAYRAITSTTANLSAGVWYHATCVFDDSNNIFRLYLNGVEIANQAETNSPTLNNEPVILGAAVYGAGAESWFSGTLDDIKIYNYARTPAQVAWDYNRGKPVGWWKMDESLWNGTAFEVKDSSGNAMHGTRGGNATTTTGKLNNGGTFDGSGDYVDIGNSIYHQFTSSYTLATWFNATAWPGSGNFDDLINKSDSNDGYWLELNDTDDINCGFGYGASYVDHDASAFNGTTGTWYHAACVFDTVGNTMKIYINGTEIYSATENNDPSLETAYLSLGSWNVSASQEFSGKMDDVRIYNYPLTPQQVRLIMNEGAVSFHSL